MVKQKKLVPKTWTVPARQKRLSFLTDRIHFHTNSFNELQAKAKRVVQRSRDAKQRSDLKTAEIHKEAASRIRELAEWHRARRIELKEQKKALFP